MKCDVVERKRPGLDGKASRVRCIANHGVSIENFEDPFHDSVILATTIRETIAYGRPNATEAEIRKAAELARAGQFIEQLPEGYRTRLTEGGQNLSGAQKQRIAIARALVPAGPLYRRILPRSRLTARRILSPSPTRSRDETYQSLSAVIIDNSLIVRVLSR